MQSTFWYTDPVIDGVAHIAVHGAPDSTIHHQDCVVSTALVPTVERKHSLHNGDIAPTVDTVTSRLANTVESLVETGCLATGCYFPCANMKPTEATIAFACDPLGFHWSTIQVNKHDGMYVFNSSLMAKGTELTMAILTRALILYATVPSSTAARDCAYPQADYSSY